MDGLDAQRAQAARQAAQQERADMAWLMSGQRGRRVVWRQLEQGGVFRNAYMNDALAMAFAEGCRNTALRMLAAVHAMPEYQVMVVENAITQRPAEAMNDEQEAP